MAKASLVRPKKAANDLKIVMVPTDTLRASEYNPRVWDDAAAEKLRESIRRFGFVDPLIANSAKGREGVLVGGHFRLQCAKDLGITEVPVVFLHITDIKRERELNLRLNKNSGSFDMDLLKAFDIDMLLDVGFDDTDLTALWGDSLATEDDGFDLEQAVEEVKTTTVKTGDLYALGAHKLLCGDSTKLENVQRLVGKETISMIDCDPPFDIGLSYDRGVSCKPGKYGGLMTNDSWKPEEYRAFLKKTMENALAVAKPDCHVFYWSDECMVGVIQSLFTDLGLTNRRVCIWVKDNATPTAGVAFNKCIEMATYATRGKPFLAPTITNLNEIMNKEIGTGNRLIDDVMDQLQIWLVKRLPAQEYEHPTSKNPTLHEKALRRCTKINDAVLDLFGGSGSFLISADQLRRRAFLCEQEPIFCQVILNRYEKLTGIKPKLIR